MTYQTDEPERETRWARFARQDQLPAPVILERSVAKSPVLPRRSSEQRMVSTKFDQRLLFVTLAKTSLCVAVVVVLESVVWGEYSSRYDLYASQAVLDEASAGDAYASEERLRMLHGIPLIPITDDVQNLAAELLARHLLPAKASVDALHVAAAAVGAVD